MRLDESLARIHCYEITIGDSCSTDSEQLVHVPDLRRSAVNDDLHLHYLDCRLLKIFYCRYVYGLKISSLHRMQYDFGDSVLRLQQLFIQVLTENNIEIRLPSQAFLVEFFYSEL